MNDEFARLVETNYAREEEKMAIARAMLLEGIAKDVIVKCTGLTEEELNTIPLA